MNTKSILAGVLVVAALAALYIVYQDRYSGEPALASASINAAEIQVSIADDQAERIQGLSGVAELGPTEGKLFIFDESGAHGIWMKDMVIALDVFWLDENLRVVHIEPNMTPGTFPTIFESEVPARFVLEMSAGFAESFTVNIGDELKIDQDLLPEDLR